MQKQHSYATTEKDKAVFTLDQCRAAFLSGVAGYFIKALLDHPAQVPGMNRGVLQQSVDQLNRCIREIRKNTLPHEQTYLDQNLKPGKLQDIAAVIEVLSRIGIEEDQRAYEEFLGMILDLVDEVFYAQKNRRKIYFPKYKALFEIISKEIRSDVNDQPGQLLWQNKSLYIRTAAPEVPHNIK
jgi:hypothetical protein